MKTLKEALISKDKRDWAKSVLSRKEKEKIAKKLISQKDIISKITDFVDGEISDWSSSWEEEEDMYQDLDSLVDWFWNELEINIEEIKERLLDDIDQDNLKKEIDTDTIEALIRDHMHAINKALAGLASSNIDYYISRF